MTPLALMVACGMVTGAGVSLVMLGTHRAPIRLSDALARLDAAPTDAPTDGERLRGLDAAGAWAQRHLRLSVTARQRQLLRMSGRSTSDFFAEKLVLVSLGLLAPAFWVVLQTIILGPVSPAPALLGPILAVGGYFLADYRLAASSKTIRRSTSEAVHTFFDLVALERLANTSATQAVSVAAGVSEAPLFRRISAGLERCRLEQTTPWRELRRIAQEWDLPELADLSDVMRLEEQGAALAETLQARVRELREAFVAEQRMQAQHDTEALTLWMTLPALILGLAFIIPPLFILVAR